MELLYNKALVVSSSNKVLFFKQIKDLMTKEIKWTQYHELKIRGQIYFIKGNVRIQVASL